MTRIAFTPADKDEYGFARLSVNGRYLGIPQRITELYQVKPGRWEGTANGEPFVIKGGKAAGGDANEWYFTWKPFTGDQELGGPRTWARSAKECICEIENS